MLAYIAEKDEIHPDAISLLEKNNIAVTYTKNPDAEVLFIRTYTTANKNYLSNFPKLQYILRAGVGIDNIDSEYCKQNHITILNAPGSNANAVAEYIIGVIIMSLRYIPIQRQSLKQQNWRSSQYLGSEIKNKTVGIVGCGAIGKLIAKKLDSFEHVTLLGYDPFLNTNQLAEHHIKKCDLDELLRQSDIITLHLPLMKETKNLINKEKLSLMKSNCCLINAARGGIVHEQDLLHAIQKKIINTAVLDVFESEPAVRKELLQEERIICTPHIAGFTQEATKEMAIMPVMSLLKLLQ